MFSIALWKNLFVILRTLFPLIIASFNERGKVSLGEYSFILVAGLTSFIDICIRYMYFKQFDKHMFPIETYVDLFDSLISVPKKLQIKVRYFTIGTDVALVVLMTIRMVLILNQYFYYSKHCLKHLTYFVVYVIQDLSIIVADIQMLQVCYKLFIRFKTVNVKLKCILISVDKLIVVPLKRKLEVRKSNNSISKSRESTRNKLQKVIDENEIKFHSENATEEILHHNIENLNISKDIADLHTAYYYAYQAFKHFHAFYQLQTLVTVTVSFLMAVISTVLLNTGDPQNFNGRFVHAERNEVVTCVVRILLLANVVHLLKPQVKNLLSAYTQ